jgi:hypothetical protein
LCSHAHLRPGEDVQAVIGAQAASQWRDFCGGLFLFPGLTLDFADFGYVVA